MLVSSKKDGEDEEGKEEDPGQEDPEGEDGQKKKEDSDLSEEEEIKVPQRDLTGKSYKVKRQNLIIYYFYRIGQTFHRRESRRKRLPDLPSWIL